MKMKRNFLAPVLACALLIATNSPYNTPHIEVRNADLMQQENTSNTFIFPGNVLKPNTPAQRPQLTEGDLTKLQTETLINSQLFQNPMFVDPGWC